MHAPAASTPADRTVQLTLAGLNLIQQALSIYDADLRLAVANARFQEMFGLPDALASPGASFEDTVRWLAEHGEYGPLEDLDAFVAARVEQARAFRPHYMERTRANGRTIAVEGSPLAQGGWVAVYTDITAIKRQEALLRARSEELHAELVAHAEELSRTNRQLAATIAQLEQTQRELRETDRRMRLATEATPAHIAHIGPDRRYSYSNRRLSSLVPGAPDDIVGRRVSEVLGAAIHAEISGALEAAFAGRPAVVEFTEEETGRRLRAAFTPDRAPDGAVSGVYVLSMDITEEAQARARTLQTHKRELAAQLTNGLAHDFANLLTIILGAQSRLARRDDLPADVRELIATTRAAALRGGRVLDRLAAISGPRVLSPTATSIPALLSDLAELCAPTLGDDIGIATRAAPELDHPVLIDAGSLQDALLNLILNARDAIAGAGGSGGAAGGTIEIAADTQRDTWLRIRVRDTGPGFSQSALEHALEPFFTTKSGDHGSGLGLSMVYDFAQLAGGRLKLRNRPEGGAEVTLLLPLRFALPATAPTLVLLVDDDAALRDGVRAMLRELGHTVIEAASAEEAEMLAGIEGVGLVLSDISLGGETSGVELARSVAALGRPVVLMTSLPPGAPLRAEAEAGFPVLQKPFAPAALDAAIAAARATRALADADADADSGETGTAA